MNNFQDIDIQENNSIPIITLNDGSTSRISLAPNHVLELQANSLGRVSFAIPISTDGQEDDHTSDFTHNSMEVPPLFLRTSSMADGEWVSAHLDIPTLYRMTQLSPENLWELKSWD